MESNIWRRFGELIKPAAEEIVTVKGAAAEGVISAETLSGGTVRLRCAIDVQIGDKVIAAGGAVLAKAPDLPYFELMV